VKSEVENESVSEPIEKPPPSIDIAFLAARLFFRAA